jgi:alkylated DNA nucleotide flippase Atl1
MFRITQRPDTESAEASGVYASYGDVAALAGAPDS